MKNDKAERAKQLDEDMKEIAFAYREGKITAWDAMKQRRALYSKVNKHANKQ